MYMYYVLQYCFLLVLVLVMYTLMCYYLQMHNDPKEMAWARRKNFVMFLFMIGYRTTADRRGIIAAEVVGKDGQSLSAQNRVFCDESGLVRYFLSFV
jgi:hypothetical protein